MLLFLVFEVLAVNAIITFFFFQSVMAILPLAITLILQGLKQYLDLKQYFPVQIQKKLPLCDYEMYLPVLKAVLNDLKESCQNET